NWIPRFLCFKRSRHCTISSDSSEDEDEVANIVKRRKEMKENVEKAKKITNRDIIAAHANARAKIREELEAKLKKAEEDVKYWQNKYEELRNSNSFHLTDKTGRQILGVLNDVSSRLKTGEAMNGLIPNSQTKEETVGLTKGSNICIGSKIWLPKLIYDTIMREKECSALAEAAKNASTLHFRQNESKKLEQAIQWSNHSSS
ncbi:hypothetical protein PV325_003936, partial [Microctonus aethiopoides]